MKTILGPQNAKRVKKDNTNNWLEMYRVSIVMPGNTCAAVVPSIVWIVLLGPLKTRKVPLRVKIALKENTRKNPRKRGVQIVTKEHTWTSMVLSTV
jgi:hypothetical protein